MATKKFRCAMYYQVGTKVQRILIDGCGKGVIYYHDSIYFFCGFRQSLHIYYLQCRVCWCFEINKIAAFGNLFFKLIVISGVAKFHIDIVVRKKIEKDLTSSTISI